MLGSNQRPQREWSKVCTRTATRPAIGRTGGAIATLPDRFPLDHALTVGRQAMPGQIVLDHPNVSRCQAAFEEAGGSIVLRDLGGANGTYVNGARLRGARSLVSGDRIDVGPFELTFDGTALTRVWRVGNVELLVRGVSYAQVGIVKDTLRHPTGLLGRCIEGLEAGYSIRAAAGRPARAAHATPGARLSGAPSPAA